MQGKMSSETWFRCGLEILNSNLGEQSITFPEFLSALEGLIRRYKSRLAEEKCSTEHHFAVILPFPSNGNGRKETTP